MATKNALKLITNYCKHCSEAIVRIPHDDALGEEMVYVYSWLWIHHNTGDQTCRIDHVAEPKAR